ncbi:hypothetical protein RPMA_19155 [Tardiphaga alba]|uniref:Uncharacterized protein n=1 Tax=Tardiphaga alba TaxID=340268 RepID=A0ABX8ADJ7_9BRAD|nr:hypothetical protein [Tardiphaga alba]QUS40714.1 hypothetical protein RPMA_19155 [Tardiphaga alba]
MLFDAINSGKATAFGWDGKGPPRPFDIKSLPYWLDDLRLVLFAGVVRDPETWPKRSMLYVVLKQAQIARLLRAKKSKKKRTELCEFEIDGLVTLIEEFAEEHGTLIPFEPLWDLLRPHLSRHMGRDLFNTSIYMKLRCALPTGGGGRRKKSVVVGFHNSREELRELVGKFINTPFLAE